MVLVGKIDRGKLNEDSTLFHVVDFSETKSGSVKQLKESYLRVLNSLELMTEVPIVLEGSSSPKMHIFCPKSISEKCVEDVISSLSSDEGESTLKEFLSKRSSKFSQYLWWNAELNWVGVVSKKNLQTVKDLLSKSAGVSEKVYKLTLVNSSGEVIRTDMVSEKYMYKFQEHIDKGTILVQDLSVNVPELKQSSSF
jgi:hypothetical protein